MGYAKRAAGTKGKHRIPDPWLPIPRSLLREGGALDTLSGEAWRLLILLLERGPFEKKRGGHAYGGARGERTLAYSTIRRRFRWKDDKIQRVFDELKAAGFVRVSIQGGMQAGYHVASQYVIGPAHPWSDQKAAPQLGSGPSPDSGGGRPGYEASPPPK